MYKALSTQRNIATWLVIVSSIIIMICLLILVPRSSAYLYIAMVCSFGLFSVRCVAAILELWQEQNTTLKVADSALQIFYRGSLAYTIPYEIINTVKKPKNLNKTTIESNKFDYPLSVDESACEEFYKELEDKGIPVVEAA